VAGSAENEAGRPTRPVDAVRTLELGTKSNSGSQSDDRWFPLLLAGLGDCVVDASEITTNPLARGSRWPTVNSLVTIIHMENLPIVRCESTLDVLGKGDSSVSVDGNV
jgi:hypothetical protein